MPVGSAGRRPCNRAGSQAPRFSRLVAKAASSRSCGSSRTATAPRAGEPPMMSSRSSATTRPLPAVTCPSACQAWLGAGSSSDRSGPRPLIRPTKPPSAETWPDRVPPVPTAEPWPSRLTWSGADPSAPVRPSRPVICQARPITAAVPATAKVPVAGSTRRSAVMALTCKPPTASVPSSRRACSPAGATSRGDTNAVSGQGSRICTPRSARSCGSIRPASSAPRATRSRSWAAVALAPSPVSGTVTSPATSVASGSSDRRIGPAIRTGRPRPAEATASTAARYCPQSSTRGTIQAAVTVTASERTSRAANSRSRCRPLGRGAMKEIFRRRPKAARR